jgi:hypothetical protein
VVAHQSNVGQLNTMDRNKVDKSEMYENANMCLLDEKSFSYNEEKACFV